MELYILNQLYLNLLFQIGGNDQLGNMITGHDLIKKASGNSVYGKFVVTSVDQDRPRPFTHLIWQISY